MPERAIDSLDGTMCQHAFQGRRVFQHRSLNKWRLEGNPRVSGFEFEDECRHSLQQRRPHPRLLRGWTAFDPKQSRPLTGCTVAYHRVGHDRRMLTLEPNGTIGEGADRMERAWGVRREGTFLVLETLSGAR